MFTTGVKRHYELEFGIKVDVAEDVHEFYYIQFPGEPNIPGICFLCEYRSGEPHSVNHDPPRWVTEQELQSIPKEDFIPGVKDEFVRFLAEFKKRNGL